jgi:hypothetical protein
VNPEAAWPHIDALAETCRAAGFVLRERLAIYDDFMNFLPASIRPLAFKLQAAAAPGVL